MHKNYYFAIITLLICIIFLALAVYYNSNALLIPTPTKSYLFGGIALASGITSFYFFKNDSLEK
jgi:hypothetical protein